MKKLYKPLSHFAKWRDESLKNIKKDALPKGSAFRNLLKDAKTN